MVEDDACAGSTIFRSNNQEIQAGNCDCASNRQCERRVGKGAKCIQVGEDCSGACPSGTTSGCMAPCTDLNPPA